MRKFHLEQKQSKTNFDLENGFSFIHIYPKGTTCGKDKVYKILKRVAARVWELGSCGDGAVSSGTIEISVSSFHSPYMKTADL